MLYAIVAVLAVILDQAVKYWTTVNVVVDTGEAKLIPGLLHLANVHNTGAAFSFLEGARWFFVILCLIFVLVVIYALSKNLITQPACRWAAVFVLAGAIGNCIDRIVCGFVVDMFELELFRFPVFNVADIYITVGVIVFCVALLLEKPKPAGKKAAAPAAERKPVSRRQEPEEPELPKPRIDDVPPLDPSDPFAEWEKRANTPAEPTPAVKTVYTQPAASVPAEPVEEPEPIDIPVVEAPPEPEFSLPPDFGQTESAGGADEFDLDSILDEFKEF